jgi:hypothetical protein
MKIVILFIMLIMSINTYSQECPCIKTAIIGTNVKSSYNYNNYVVAMEDTEIPQGTSIQLTTQKKFGNVTWYKDGVELFNTFVSPTETTKYTVKSSLNGCPDSFDKVKIKVKTPLSEQENLVSVYPVPTRNLITFSAPKNTIKSIRISNLVGVNVINYSCENNIRQQTLNISSFEVGTYIASICLDNNTVITCKILKN